MILLLGDIHGNTTVLKNAIRYAEENNAAAVIQVGDFGLFQRDGIDTGFYKAVQNSTIPVYFIEGNHDDCTRWVSYPSVKLTTPPQVWEDVPLFYIPRGSVLEIDDRIIAFMGGAASIDKNARLKYNWHWDENELLTNTQILSLHENRKDLKIDMFITHCPPNSVIETHFDPIFKLAFGVGIDWTDPTQTQIENMWKAMNTMIYSGHMHQTVKGENYRILDINERLLV